MTLRSTEGKIGERDLVRFLKGNLADREKFPSGNIDDELSSLSETDLIEDILFFATPLRDMRTIAQRLIDRFGSYANVISASTDELRSVSGVEIEVLTAFKLIRSAVICLLREEVRTRPIMGNLESLSRYLRGLLGRERGECLHILFLDAKNYLIADEIVFHGSVKTVQIDLRRVVERIIYYNASAIILVHNHPSGDPKPNKFDIELTEKVRDFLLELDVSVHDHIIVSTNACFSLVRGIIL